MSGGGLRRPGGATSGESGSRFGSVAIAPDAETSPGTPTSPRSECAADGAFERMRVQRPAGSYRDAVNDEHSVPVAEWLERSVHPARTRAVPKD